MTTNNGISPETIQQDIMERPNFSAISYFMARYKLMYLSILAVALPVSILEGVGILAFLPLFSDLLGNSSGTTTGFAGFAMGLADIIPVDSPFVAAVLFLVGIFTLKTFGILGRDLLVAYTGAKILYNVKREIMERYSNAEYQFMLDSQQGSLIFVGLAAPSSVSNLHSTLLRGGTAAMKIIAIGVALTSLLPLVAMAFLGLGLVYYLIIHYLSKKISYKIGQGRAVASSRLNIISNEFLNGFRQIITFNAAKRWEADFEKENRTYSELYAKDQAIQAIPRPLLEFAALGLLMGSVGLLKTVSPGTFAEDLATLGVFAVAIVQILPSLNTFGGTRLLIMSVLPNVQAAHKALTQSVPARHEGNLQLPSFEDKISFEEVCFAHRNRDVLLDKVTMSFEKGKVTAIVGPSGSGKSTLINLILGLFNPSEGNITIDGTPLRDLTHGTWLNRIGFVSQDPFITNNTIEENIRFNRDGQTFADIENAATIANAHNFINEFPQGYKTITGDRGIKLSGGQQQRLCIARAVLGSPEILIFDEATSSLDSIAETQVQEAIDDASANRTVIIIAHRLSTIRQADKIIVLENGKVLEQGTHQELLEINGQYAKQVAAST